GPGLKDLPHVSAGNRADPQVRYFQVVAARLKRDGFPAPIRSPGTHFNRLKPRLSEQLLHSPLGHWGSAGRSEPLDLIAGACVCRNAPGRDRQQRPEYARHDLLPALGALVGGAAGLGDDIAVEAGVVGRGHASDFTAPTPRRAAVSPPATKRSGASPGDSPADDPAVR